MKLKVAAIVISSLMFISVNTIASCRQSGNTTYCDDGTTYRHSGNTTYSSDGTTYRRSGNTTYGSHGTTCREVGNTTYCN